MRKVIPAVLPLTFYELKEKLELLKGVAREVQIDVTDGFFAGRTSWPLAKADKNFEKIIEGEEGMPYWENFDFEIDLMVKNPFSIAEDFVKAGAAKIIFHLASFPESDISKLETFKNEGIVEVGIAVMTGESIEKIKNILPFADFVQVMGIRRIGYQGEPFDEKVPDFIKLLKTEFPDLVISVDGGMNPETADKVFDAGADRVIAGSFILNSTNPIEAVKEIEGLL